MRRRARGSPPFGFLASLFPVLLALLLFAWAGPSRTQSGEPPRPQAEPPAEASPAPAQRLQVILRARMPSAGASPELRLDTETFRASPALPCFYERRGHLPAWSDGQRPLPAVDDLLEILARAADEGLRPEDYRADALRRLVAARQASSQSGDWAELDLLLTDAFLTYAGHLHAGRVHPERLYTDCQIPRSASDLAQVLEDALAAGGIGRSLAHLAPHHPSYAGLRQALADHRRLVAAGGWAEIPAGPALKAGDGDPRVTALRARLVVPGAPVYDETLAEAVRAFQGRHGLETDGVVGPVTLRALNVPAAERLRQIEINLERWRWLPHDLGSRHVRVNIAGFELEAVADGRSALRMKVIVGKPYTRTPVFTSAMTDVVVNPTWHVPASIVHKEILPRLSRDPGYLRRQGMVMTRSGGRVEIHQRPGPQNALGRLKFLFPNRFNVYLHDTPSQSLFGRTVRTFSHGCIRIEKPRELAAWALADDPKWTPEALGAAIAAGRERRVALPSPIPVHVNYWTAWVDEAGVLQLRDDVYGRDGPLRQALAAP